jgi:hypothetical protein
MVTTSALYRVGLLVDGDVIGWVCFKSDMGVGFNFVFSYGLFG